MSTSPLHEILQTALGHAGAVVSTRLERPVEVVETAAPEAQALIRFDLAFEHEAVLTWLVPHDDATGFSDLLIGGTGERGSVTEMHLDALAEACSSMLENAVDSMNASLSAPLTAGSVDMGMETGLPELASGDEQLFFALQIDGFGPLTIVQVVNRSLLRLLNDRYAGPAPAPAAQPVAPAEPAQEAPANAEVPAAAQAHAPADNVFELPATAPRGDASGELQMLLDVPMQMTVQLGSTERRIRDILELNIGSILELDKLAGDPMDIMVNGKVLARGEVVVIDEDFGIRITEILTPEQRLRSLG